jgi:hypothetical protein
MMMRRNLSVIFTLDSIIDLVRMSERRRRNNRDLLEFASTTHEVAVLIRISAKTLSALLDVIDALKTINGHGFGSKDLLLEFRCGQGRCLKR